MRIDAVRDDRRADGGEDGRVAATASSAAAARVEDEAAATATIAAMTALADGRDADGVVAKGLDFAAVEIDDGRAADAAQTTITGIARNALGVAAVAAIAADARGGDAGRVVAGRLHRAIDVDGREAAIGAVVSVAAVGKDIAVGTIAATAALRGAEDARGAAGDHCPAVGGIGIGAGLVVVDRDLRTGMARRPVRRLGRRRDAGRAVGRTIVDGAGLGGRRVPLAGGRTRRDRAIGRAAAARIVLDFGRGQRVSPRADQ